VIHTEAKTAKILQDSHDKGVLRKMETQGVFELESKEPSQNWILTHKVDGEVRPFSIACYFAKSNRIDNTEQQLCLKIKDHIFFHKNNSYSIGAAIPIGGHPGDFLTGVKYICRLVNFPFSGVDHIDSETKHRMKRYRGIAVGEFYGLGADGYHVKIHSDELTDIGLPLTASTYLLYTTR
jgi:hypothetical protein